MTAYYNEIDPFAAAWLRKLIKAGHIAPGIVDERSIEDIAPNELREFTQCHFFAGIGVWSYALRQAGWPDDHPVWTGSCPCQPFSAAGKGGGTTDERHLWPAWFHLIEQCRPDVVFGEQVEAAIRHSWLDLVQADLEGIGYACGAVGLPAAGFGAPHIRARLFFVADSNGRNASAEREQCGGEHGQQSQDRGITGSVVDDNETGRDRVAAPRLHERRKGEVGEEHQEGNADGSQRHDTNGRGATGSVADSGGERRQQERQSPSCNEGENGWEQDGNHIIAGNGADGELVNAERARLEGHAGDDDDGQEPGRDGAHKAGSVAAPGPVNGFWRNAEWLPCIDGRARPVEPGTFPLAHGAPARVGRLRGYGNAINAEAAKEFIKAYLDVR